MFRHIFGSRKPANRRPGQYRPTVETLEGRITPSAFAFSNGATTNLIAVASHPDSTSTSTDEVEAADDFIVPVLTTINSATFIGLLPTGAAVSTITDVHVEVYQVFPESSNTTRTITVPTRANSPSDVDFAEDDSVAGSLTFTTTVLSASFTAQNSVVTGINPKPNQTTGGEGAVTGEEVQFNVTLTTPFQLPEDHYFFVPQVQLSSGNFLWLSATRPNTTFSPDLQAWVRGPKTTPDWLRVGTDIVGGATPPTFNMSFTLSGSTNQNEQFVQALYNDFLGRSGSEAELEGWVNDLPNIGQSGVANDIIHSNEALTHLVAGLYVHYLGRSPTGTEDSGWINLLASGGTEEQVITGIVGSTEFAGHANTLIGGTNASTNYVQALYKLILNRTGSTAEVNSWLSSVASLGNPAVAGQFLTTQEFRTDFVTGLYSTLLDRTAAPSAAEVASWVNTRLHMLNIDVAFASSNEYYLDG